MKNCLRVVSGGGLAAMVVTSVAAAQRPANEIGVMAGVNFAKVSGSDVVNSKSRTGFIAGGFARLGVANHVAIEPEVLYSQQGAKASDAGLQGTIKLDYIQFPLLLRVIIPTKGTANIHPSLFAGPALGFKSSCKIKAASGSTSITEDCATDPDTKVKSTDFLVLFGGGLDVRRLTFGIRYALGLSKVDGSTDPGDAKNRVFSFTVGYGFRLRK